jgi:hypothetical protein
VTEAWFGVFLLLWSLGAWDARWSSPPFPKAARHGLIDFPIEKIIIARPRVDLDPANLTTETARVLVWMLLPYRGVRQPAIGAGKMFGRPHVASHHAIMRTGRTGSNRFPHHD